MVKVSINPPPIDRKCYGCGVIGLPLDKVFRPMVSFIPEEYNIILSEINYDASNFDFIGDKYGLDNLETAILYDQLHSTIVSSWECCNCVIK